MIHETPVVFNKIPGVSIVSNKRKMAEIFKRYNRNYESDFNFTPITFSIPKEKDLLNFHLKRLK
jgi:hypothetical protein